MHFVLEKRREDIQACAKRLGKSKTDTQTDSRNVCGVLLEAQRDGSNTDRRGGGGQGSSQDD